MLATFWSQDAARHALSLVTDRQLAYMVRPVPIPDGQIVWALISMQKVEAQ